MDITIDDDDDKFLIGPTFNIDPASEKSSHRDMIAEISAWIPSESQEYAELESQRLASIEAQNVSDRANVEARALANQRRIDEFEQLSKALEISEIAKEEIRRRKAVFDEQYQELRSRVIAVSSASNAEKFKKAVSRLKFW